MDEAIKIEHLCCGYGNKFSLRDINLTIPVGQFAAIIGPNGAGKTTLFKSIAGMLPISGGKIYIEGEDTSKMPHKAKARKIAIVNQTVEAGFITIEDYVLMGRLPYRKPLQFFESKEDYEIAEECMKMTGVWDKRDKMMNRLSGGEQQLAAVARALAQNTHILLLDEPTAHLDISHQMKILNLIQKLNQENHLTVLLIIHDLNLASEFSDHLFMLDKGGLYVSGTPEEVLTFNHIEEVYETVVLTRTSPVSGKPFVFPISESALKQRK